MTQGLKALDKRYLFHPASNLDQVRDGDPIIWSRGEGIYVYDQHGRK